jgi:hypothetical protein
MIKDNIRLAVRMPYRLRGLLIRGAARRILNSGPNIAYTEMPSVNSMIVEVIERRLGEPIQERQTHEKTKKTILMLHLRKRLHAVMKADCEKTGKSQARLVSELIEKTNLHEMKAERSAEVDSDEAKGSVTFQVNFDCRTKLFHEIAIRMLSKKTRVGRSEFNSIGDIVNELIAAHYNLPLPLEKAESSEYSDDEQFSFLTTLPKSLHVKLAEYCDKETKSGDYTSANATIVEWCEDAAAKEFW